MALISGRKEMIIAALSVVCPYTYTELESLQTTIHEVCNPSAVVTRRAVEKALSIIKELQYIFSQALQSRIAAASMRLCESGAGTYARDNAAI